jgi:phosphofructokinase-like protein
MKIAISTGGGDAPGINAVIRAAVLSAVRRGWDVVGVRDGWNGLLLPERYTPERPGLIRLDRDSVRGVTHLGGTILGTTNRGSPLRFPVTQPDGSIVETDRSAELVAMCKREGFDAVIMVGGDGTMAIAAALSRHGLRVIGVPKTIDNDLDGTVVTFGFETAVSFASDCIDRLHTTAASHDRIMVVEVMGRYAGWIALHAGLAATADAILLPEIPYDIASVVAKIGERAKAGRNFSMIVAAEGALPKDGGRVIVEGAKAGHAERLGGVGERLAQELGARTGQDARAVVLGHLLRGGPPIAFDRLLSLRFGAAAVRALADGASGVMVALDPPTVKHVPLEEATRRMKSVPLDCDTILTARELGICLGD